MATTADFRRGLCIKHSSGLYSIVEFQHVKPGKGGAFVRTKLKNVRTGKVLENTFNAGTSVEVVRVERKKFQFLYQEDNYCHLMDTENFEQIQWESKNIEGLELLKEGQEIEILLEGEGMTPIACDLPPFVDLKIVYSEPGIKGDTATSATKTATLETGYKLQVPLFIAVEETIRIDTRTKKYHERVKK